MPQFNLSIKLSFQIFFFRNGRQAFLRLNLTGERNGFFQVSVSNYRKSRTASSYLQIVGKCVTTSIAVAVQNSSNINICFCYNDKILLRILTQRFLFNFLFLRRFG